MSKTPVKKPNSDELRQIASRILDGSADYRDVLKEYKIQSYQLWNWIGKVALEREQAKRKTYPHKQSGLSDIQSLLTGGRPLSEEDVDRIAAWYLRRRVLADR